MVAPGRPGPWRRGRGPGRRGASRRRVRRRRAGPGRRVAPGAGRRRTGGPGRRGGPGGAAGHARHLRPRPRAWTGRRPRRVARLHALAAADLVRRPGRRRPDTLGRPVAGRRGPGRRPGLACWPAARGRRASCSPRWPRPSSRPRGRSCPAGGRRGPGPGPDRRRGQRPGPARRRRAGAARADATGPAARPPWPATRPGTAGRASRAGSCGGAGPWSPAPGTAGGSPTRSWPAGWPERLDGPASTRPRGQRRRRRARYRPSPAPAVSAPTAPTVPTAAADGGVDRQPARGPGRRREGQHGPAVDLGVGGQLAVGVDRVRAPDGREHGQVGGGVGVGVAGVQVVAVLLGEAADHLGLVGPVGVELDDAGEAAVDGPPWCCRRRGRPPGAPRSGGPPARRRRTRRRRRGRTPGASGRARPPRGRRAGRARPRAPPGPPRRPPRSPSR